MSNEALGYVKDKETGDVFPYIDKDKNGWKIKPQYEPCFWGSTKNYEEVSELSEDVVNPIHYKTSGIEPFEYMKMKMSKEAYEGFLAGNIIKYISRYQQKNGVEDIKKLKRYSEKLIESMEG